MAVSLDGATTGFEPDVATFYALAGTWREDVTLAGADTILAQEAALASAPAARTGGRATAARRRGRTGAGAGVQALREVGHWSYGAATGPPSGLRLVGCGRVGELVWTRHEVGGTSRGT